MCPGWITILQGQLYDGCSGPRVMIVTGGKMRNLKSRVRIWQASLMVLSLALVAAGFPAGQSDPESKIDRVVIDMLTDSSDGTGPFFVVFGDRTPLAAAHSIQDWDARGRFVVDSLQATAAHSQNGVRGYLQGHKVAYVPFWVENKIYIPAGTLDLARELARRSEVAAIIPEQVFTLSPLSTAITTQSVGWNISRIGADLVWSAYGNDGKGIVVASVDTGVQYTHPALVGQYRGNLGGGAFSHAGNWYDATNVCGTAPCDDAGHGTHTVGTMVGNDGSSQIGVAPGAKWIACKGCAGTNCASSALISCAQWIMAPAGDPSKRPNVVNNSWGGSGSSPWYQSYVQNWVAAGIFPSFAVGNSGPGCNTAGSPGDYPQSFASGATDANDVIAGYSSRGPSGFGGIKPDVSAPGVNIYSSVPTNSYAYYSGTSMASPHIAGAVALLWAIRPGYLGNISATETLLEKNAKILTTTETCGGIAAGSSPNNTYGAGRIDIKKSVDAAGGTVNQPPTVTISTPATDGQQFNCGTGVIFAGTAYDSTDGDLTGTIQWSGPGTPSIVTGGSITKTFSCINELGTQSITALVTDSEGLTGSDTVMINIVSPPAIPAAPSSLQDSVLGRNVTLTWTDNSTNEQGFKVYRRQQSGKKWSGWAILQTVTIPNATQYTDAVGSGGSYQYYLTAFNSAGESAPSGTTGARVK